MGLSDKSCCSVRRPILGLLDPALLARRAGELQPSIVGSNFTPCRYDVALCSNCRTIIIGLAGGIGSGKTRVGYLFRRLKTPLIEADKIVHGLLGRLAVKKALQRLYGDKIFNKFKINHQELARISFANRKSVNRLNKLLHPLVRKEIIRQITACCARAVAIDAALLMETRLSDICDFIVFVKTNKSTRLKRVKASRNWPAVEVTSRERFQMPAALKEQRADFIIDNNGSVRNTFKQVKEIISKILTTRTDD